MSSTVAIREPTDTSLPVRLNENPNGLVSLLEMLRFYAESFCRTSGLIGQVYAQIQQGIQPTTFGWKTISSSLAEVDKYCREMGLAATCAQMARVQQMLTTDSGSFRIETFGMALMEVQTRLIDELEARALYAVESDYAGYVTDHQFAPSVVDRFPDSAFDLDEAAKCYAFGRSTACVFHLMRITEHGLNAVAGLLSIVDPLGPNWDQVIKKIDSELKADYKDRRFKGQAEVLSHISTHLHAVKIAWRNKTMHVDKKHTQEEAREIYSATRGLMRYLAEHLQDTPKLSVVERVS